MSKSIGLINQVKLSENSIGVTAQEILTEKIANFFSDINFKHIPHEQIIEKFANSLPADTTQWAGNIFAELTDRLYEVKSWFQRYRTIISPDEQGNALGLVILRGAKAFIPIVVREWDIKPIDLIVYKKGKELKFCYLSKRNLLGLLISSSLGAPLDDVQTNRSTDAFINLLSPIGGATVTNNPFFGMGMRNKMASDFAIKYIGETGLPKYSDFVRNLLEVPDIKIKPQYKILEKTASDRFIIYEPFGKEDGLEISKQEVLELFDKIDNHQERIKMGSDLGTNGYTLFGNVLNRNGNVLMRYRDPSSELTRDVKPKLPPRDGVFMFNNQVTYINPKVKYLNGDPSSYALGIQKGEFTLSKNFENFIDMNLPESSDLSREQLMAEKKLSHVEPGDTLAIFSISESWVTIPFKVISVSEIKPGIYTLSVLPLLGPQSKVNITFYDRDNVLIASENDLYYPLLTSSLVDLNMRFNKYGGGPGYTETNPNHIKVNISKGGSYGYYISEDRNVLGNMSLPKTIFTLISRYGFSEAQAKRLLKDVDISKLAQFHVLEILTEKETVPQLNKLDDFPSFIEKEAIKATVKLATELMKYNSFPESVSKNANLLFQDMNVLYENTFPSKEAAEELRGSESSEERTQRNSQNLNAQHSPVTDNTQRSIGFLMNSAQTDRTTREVIDLLSYYATANIRKEELAKITSELDKALADTENALCKVLFLTQMNKVPGHDESDVKVLLSDLDSYRSNLASSIVLLKSM